MHVTNVPVVVVHMDTSQAEARTEHCDGHVTITQIESMNANDREYIHNLTDIYAVDQILLNDWHKERNRFRLWHYTIADLAQQILTTRF